MRRWIFAIALCLGVTACATPEPVACADPEACGEGKWLSVLRHTPDDGQELVATRHLELPTAPERGSLALVVSRGGEVTSAARWTFVRNYELARGDEELTTSPGATLLLHLRTVELFAQGQWSEPYDCQQTLLCGVLRLSVGVSEPEQRLRIMVADLTALELVFWDRDEGGHPDAAWLDELSTTRVLFTPNEDG